MISYLGGTFRVMRRFGVPSTGGAWSVNPQKKAWITEIAPVTASAPLDRLPPFRGTDEVAYTEYAFDEGTPDAYTYRQFANGDILIVKSPRTTKQTLVKKDDPKTATAWAKINEAIQARKAEAEVTKGVMPKEDRDAIIKASGAALATIVTSFAKTKGKHKKKRKKGKGKGRNKGGEEVVEEEGGFPFAPVAIGGGVLLVIGILVASSGGGSKKSEKA